MKLAKNQANAKQQPKAEFFQFENYSHPWSMLSKNNKTYSKKLKNKQKNGLKDQECLYSWGNENEDENEK